MWCRRRAAGPRLEHLAENRRLIVRRSLLATAVGGVIPIPVLDDYFAGRVRAGMLIKLGERRQVDIAQSSAELLGDPREGTAVRNATLTAATLLALKLAWRKFFALLALGRRAEDMATTLPARHAVRPLLRQAARRRRDRSPIRRRCCGSRSTARWPSRSGRRW